MERIQAVVKIVIAGACFLLDLAIKLVVYFVVVCTALWLSLSPGLFIFLTMTKGSSWWLKTVGWLVLLWVLLFPLIIEIARITKRGSRGARSFIPLVPVGAVLLFSLISMSRGWWAVSVVCWTLSNIIAFAGLVELMEEELSGKNKRGRRGPRVLKENGKGMI